MRKLGKLLTRSFIEINSSFGKYVPGDTIAACPDAVELVSAMEDSAGIIALEVLVMSSSDTKKAYRVNLWVSKTSLTSKCSCPGCHQAQLAGFESNGKHAVAAALVFSDQTKYTLSKLVSITRVLSLKSDLKCPSPGTSLEDGRNKRS